MSELKDKIILVTGANTGIGKATALAFAQRGAQVILHARSAEKGESARAEIQAESGSPNIDLKLADLSDPAQIEGLAESIKKDYGRLDVLVNNAAIIPRHRTLTPAGLETQFMVNHLAYFWLCQALLDPLKASPQGRIVNVSSALHLSSKMDFENLQAEKSYSEWGWRHYAHTKLMNVLFTLELAERLAGTSLTANAVHPGLINTELTREVGWLKPIKRLFFGKTSDGAKTSVHVATMPEAINGKYWHNEAIAKHHPIADDPTVRAKLWEISSELMKGLA